MKTATEKQIQEISNKYMNLYYDHFDTYSPELSSISTKQQFLEKYKKLTIEIFGKERIDWSMVWAGDQMENELPITSSGSLFTALTDYDNICSGLGIEL